MDKEQQRFINSAGAAIRKIRLSKNMTLEDMQDFGFSAQHFQKLESGKKNFSFYTIYRIAKAWDMPLSDLIKEIEK